MTDPLQDISGDSAMGASRPDRRGKVLVGVKDSTSALHAFTQALALSRRLRFSMAALAVAPVYNGDLALTGVGSIQAVKSEPARTVLDEALNIAVCEAVGLETFCAAGAAHEAILRSAHEGGFGLIILGRGRGWTSPFNVAARVLRYSNIDVLVIPQNRAMRFDRIVCAAIGAPQDVVLNTAMHLASLDNGSITFFTLGASIPCISPNTFNPTQLKIETVGDVRTLHYRLRDVAENGRTDLVVLAEQQPHGLRRTLLPSLSLRLLRRAQCPLWAVKV